MELRKYQSEAKRSILDEWQKGVQKTLLVLPTGCGKTIVFSKIAEDRVMNNERVLIMAHRGELLEQASDKIFKSTGLKCSVEKAEQTSLNEWFRITVGSVQTLMREKRLNQFPKNYFNTIIVDEAHHVVSESYQKVLNHFSDAKVLGVTATPDRADMKNLGSFFESLAYEYTLPKAIKEGYLVPIKAQTIPLQIDLSSVSIQAGDYKASDVGHVLEPYLEKIAEEMQKNCQGRKIVVFLPLVKTSQKFKDILISKGFRAAEVNGDSENRSEVLKDFDDGKYDVLCNSMLLTEGWDCPSVDCIIILRPTKSRALYCQMVGRGTRLSPNKKDLLLLDFLWMVERHELCRPAYLIAESKEVADKITEKLKDSDLALDLEEVEELAKKDVLEQRERALAEQLSIMKKRKRALVDPLQFEMSIQAEDLASYEPAFGWESQEITEAQRKKLEQYGIFPDEIECRGKADLILNKLRKRRIEGLTTPKQIRLLESRGFKHVGEWKFSQATSLIDLIAQNNWRMPATINPATYIPKKDEEVVSIF